MHDPASTDAENMAFALGAARALLDDAIKTLEKDGLPMPVHLALEAFARNTEYRCARIQPCDYDDPVVYGTMFRDLCDMVQCVEFLPTHHAPCFAERIDELHFYIGMLEPDVP